MEILAVLGVIFLLAFLVETLVEFLAAPLFDHLPALTGVKWAQMYLAVAAGIAGAFVYRFDLLYLLGGFLGVNIACNAFGVAITGIAIGKGANYLHDVVSKYFVQPK